MRTVGRNTIAVIAGVAVTAAAALMLTGGHQRRALRRIGSPVEAERARGWSWLTADENGARLEPALDQVLQTLAAAPDEALIDGAIELRRRGRWGWNAAPAALLLREAALLCDGAPPEDALLAAETMREAPLDLPEASVRPALAALLEHADPRARALALEAALGWHGRAAGASIAALLIDPAETAARRLRLLALGWCGGPVPSPAAPTIQPVDLLEASLLAAALAGADASATLDLQRSWTGSPTPAFQYVLRHCDDPRAARALEQAAASGDSTARYALQARRRRVDDDQSRRLLADHAAEPWRRRIAAWRWDGVTPEQVRALLAASPADPDGSVYAAALLAERRLPVEEAAAFAATWIVDLDDDRKRAGALLAALLGAHHELLVEAYEREDVGAVRTTQRLALHALGRPVGTDAPLEFAHRVLHRSNGDFDPDVALCLLVAGETTVLDRLASRPIGDRTTYRASVQQRGWLIERFAPAWHEDAGRPIGGDVRTLELHFDLLRARWLLDRRRLAFDDASRTFAARPPS